MNKIRNLGVTQRRVAVLCVVMALAFLGLFSRLPAHLAAMEKQRLWEGEFAQFAKLFAEIEANIEERYVDEVDPRQLFEGAIRGMFATLDPHSQWLPPDSLSQLEKETEGEFSGVGLQITLRDNVLTVITPILGSPAARAGIQPWDRIVEIDGESTEGITLVEAVKKLMGPSGSKVVVKIFREGAPELIEVTLVRDTIKIESVFYRALDGQIGYLRIARWAESTTSDVDKALEEFEKSGLKGLVVDLRYNTGGLLEKVIEICDLFLPKDQVIVSTKGRVKENEREYRAQREAVTDLPMVVLVNRGSASASEIFAGAMQDTGRAVICGPEGENTFGKGSVQTITTLRNSMDRDAETGELLPSGLRLTTAKYFTPAGRSIHLTGIEPDLKVPLSNEHKALLIRRGLYGDPDTTPLFQEARPEGQPAPPPIPADFHDIQLDEAVKHLRARLGLAVETAGGV